MENALISNEPIQDYLGDKDVGLKSLVTFFLNPDMQYNQNSRTEQNDMNERRIELLREIYVTQVCQFSHMSYRKGKLSRPYFLSGKPI